MKHVQCVLSMMIFIIVCAPEMLIQASSVRPPLTVERQQYTCENITMIEFCSEVGYETASFPNYRNQPTQMVASSELMNFIALVEIVCSNVIVHFLCSVYAPFCDPSFPQIRIPPCRELCEDVRRNCEPFVVQFGLTWPPHLDCSLYPMNVESSLTFCPENLSSLVIPPNFQTHPSPPIGTTTLPEVARTDAVLLAATTTTVTEVTDTNVAMLTTTTEVAVDGNTDTVLLGTTTEMVDDKHSMTGNNIS